jgi:hypothetical protein
VNLARIALHADLERAATDLAISGELVGSRAGIDDQIERLTAKGTEDRLGDLHGSAGGETRVRDPVAWDRLPGLEREMQAWMD